MSILTMSLIKLRQHLLQMNMLEILKAVPPHFFKTGERQSCTSLEGAMYNEPLSREVQPDHWSIHCKM